MRVQKNKKTGEYRADFGDGNFVPVRVQQNKRTGEMRVLYNDQVFPYTPQSKADVPSMSWGDVGKQALSNLPDSAIKAGTDLFNAVTHPVDTLSSLGNLAMGVGAKLIPGKQESEKYADAVGDYLAGRYGGMDQFKKAVAEDPVGVLSELSTVFTGGAGLAKSAGAIGKVAGATSAANALDKVANAASIAGRVTDPVMGIAEGAGKLVAPRLYQSALMPKTTLKPQERDRLVQAGLREGIRPTQSGYDKAERIVEGLNSQVSNLIDQSTRNGATIDPVKVGNNAFENAFGKYANQATPTKDTNIVYRDINDFMGSWGASPLTPQQAQNIKTGTYKTLKEKDFRPGEPLSASKATQRALAGELRKEIENVVPQVKDLNAREGALIGLMDQIEPNIGRSGNWRMFSLPGAIGAGIYGMFSNDWINAALMGMGASALRSPGVKGQLAIMGNSGAIPRALHNNNALMYAGNDIQNQMQ